MNKTEYATLHIKAGIGDIAPTVIMVGDPGRARQFAQNHMMNARLICNIREINLWTGTIGGKDVSVMAHGMGASSVGIYAHELFAFFDVERIIRLGTCGMYVDDMELGGILIGTEYYTQSIFGLAYGLDINEPVKATTKLVNLFEETLREWGVDYRKGPVYSSLWFYAPKLIGGGISQGSKIEEKVSNGEMVAKEMEGYALQAIANYHGKEAVTVLTGINSMVKKIFNDIDTRLDDTKLLKVAELAISRMND